MNYYTYRGVFLYFCSLSLRYKYTKIGQNKKEVATRQPPYPL